MQQKILSSVSIGREGRLVVGGAAIISQKSPLYDRLGTNWEYLNPRALAGSELINFRFGCSAAEKFAVAIVGAVGAIYSSGNAIPSKELNSRITKSIAARLGEGEDAMNVKGCRNQNILSLFDAYLMLGLRPVLSVGQNYDLELKAGGMVFSYPEDKSKYRGEKREEQHIAVTAAQACGAVHLVLGNDTEHIADDRKRDGDRAGWETEMKKAAKHYEEAVAFDIGNEPAIYNLSGAYARMGQHGKASDLYKKVFELSQNAVAKAYYSSFLAENAICTKDVRRMIEALRMIDGFAGREKAQYMAANEAAEDLRAAVAKILSA